MDEAAKFDVSWPLGTHSIVLHEARSDENKFTPGEIGSTRSCGRDVAGVLAACVAPYYARSPEYRLLKREKVCAIAKTASLAIFRRDCSLIKSKRMTCNCSTSKDAVVLQGSAWEVPRPWQEGELQNLRIQSRAGQEDR